MMLPTIRLIRNRLILLAFAIVQGCADVMSNDSEDEPRTIYSVDFSAGDTSWGTVRTLLTDEEVPEEHFDCWKSWHGLQSCTVIAPVESGEMVLSSPWWLDANH